MPSIIAAVVRWGGLAPLLVAALAIMGSPGPATVAVTAAVSAYGLRRCVPYVLGLVAGTLVVLASVASGVTAALLALPVLRVVLLAASAAYILRLAYRVATAPPLREAGTEPAPSLAAGLFLGVANPKAWLGIAAVFASARLADGTAVDAGVKVAILSALAVAIMTAWTLVGASVAPLLRDERHSRIVNRSLAVALVAATAGAVLH
jgi:threonine/homoserine/homoserine lactone efflux protein